MNTSNRRKFIGTAAVLAASATTAAANPMVGMDNKYPIAHLVFYWLKNPASVTERDELIAGIKALSKIKTVKELRISVPASTEKRDFTDNSWSITEFAFFTDVEAKATYLKHPLHLEFIKKYEHLWKNILVYDGIEV